MAKKTLNDRILNTPTPIKLIIMVSLLISLLLMVGTMFQQVKNGWQEFSNQTLTLNLSSTIELEEVKLLRVVDGDTIIVKNSNGEEMRVRLIGVDTAESVHPNADKNTVDGEQASNYTKKQLKIGKKLYLEYDEEKNDQYGRTLAYVWLSNKIEPNNIKDIEEKMFNAKLINDGYAVAERFLPNTKYATVFEHLEKKGD